MNIQAEQDRLTEQLRGTRAKVDIEQSKLNAIIKKKKDFEGGKEFEEKKDNTELTKAEQVRLSNSVREARLVLFEAQTKVADISGRTKKFEEENKSLKQENDNLIKIQDKAIKEKIKMIEEVKIVKSKLQKKYDENEERISRRLDEIDTIKKDFEKDIRETEAERCVLAREMRDCIVKKDNLTLETEKVITLQSELNLKINKTEKQKKEAEKKEEEYKRHKANLKKEEDQINTIRLKVMKVLSDNKQIAELDKLRKELKQ